MGVRRFLMGGVAGLAMVVVMAGGVTWGQGVGEDALREGFASPPAAARLRCYWWWLNGHTNEAAITRDLEQMKQKGYGGVLLVDANGASQNGNDAVPAGPEFGSPAWTKLFVHALKEAHRLGLEVTLNITSGWNLGGPWVKAENASKLLTWSRTEVTAGGAAGVRLGMPALKGDFYRQIAVLAYPLHRGVALAGEVGSERTGLKALAVKSAAAEMGFSMPETAQLLTDEQAGKVDEDVDLAEVVDVSDKVRADGMLAWTPPAGGAEEWEVLRVGYTASGAVVSTASGKWQGLAIDYLDPAALDLYWKTSVQPLLDAGRPYVGNTLKYVATDSWELGGTNWTGAFREEFKKRRGYDPVAYLPVVAGRIVGSRELSTRFLADLRRTVGDLVNAHYDRMAEHAKEFGMGTQCESGGPHGAPFDGLETFRSASIVQTEFWAMSPEHRSSQGDRYFVKEASSAAHIYGRGIAAAEGPTSIGNQWNESIGMNLRPSFDEALTEGMNRLVWHEFTSSPAELGLPGQEYFAGTHMNPNVTWWGDSGEFFAYLNRSQFLMQQGLAVSDVLYYYGDQVPNFARLKADDPAKVLPGFDYDVTDTEALLERMRVDGGVLRTPEGIEYRALVLPAWRIVPLAVMEKVEAYVMAGGTVVGERPLRSQGVVTAAEAAKFAEIAERLWGGCEGSAERRKADDKGQVFCSANGRAALLAMKVRPDFEQVGGVGAQGTLDYAHRRVGETEIYFVRNMADGPVHTAVVLRAGGKRPEIFHADTGVVEESLLYRPTADGRVLVPLTLGARDSVFVVLRPEAKAGYVTTVERDGVKVYSEAGGTLPAGFGVSGSGGEAVLSTRVAGAYRVGFADGSVVEATAKAVVPVVVEGPWTLAFPEGWGAPAEVKVGELKSWTAFEDAGIKYFSGKATYRTTVRLTAEQAAADAAALLDLGDVHEVAVVTVNGKVAGTLWKAPYAVRVDGMLHEGENVVEVRVTNLWPNRLIGDAQEVGGKRFTWTNIRMYKKDSPLLTSGMMGPVRIEPVYKLVLRTAANSVAGTAAGKGAAGGAR